MRPPRPSDAGWVARLASEQRPEPIGEERILHHWQAPNVDLEADARLADNAFAIVESFGESRVWMHLHGDPERELLGWAEQRAREKGGERLLAGAWTGDARALGVLESTGFRRVRHSVRMQIDLVEPLAAPAWPEEIDVCAFESGDERTFYDVHQEAFEDHWEPHRAPYEEWRHWFLESPAFQPELWFLASSNEEPAGVAICHVHPSDPTLGWVEILGVRRPYRRHGLGKALLQHAFGEFRRCGLTRGGLGVDAENLTGAHRLYERAGMRVTHRYEILEKALT